MQRHRIAAPSNNRNATKPGGKNGKQDKSKNATLSTTTAEPFDDEESSNNDNQNQEESYSFFLF